MGRDGNDTGVDIDRLIRAVWLAEEVVGHTAWGNVSKAGPFPRGARRYSPNLPFVETERGTRHFLLGSSVTRKNVIVPWKTPIDPRQRKYLDAKAPDANAGADDEQEEEVESCLPRTPDDK